MSVTPANPVCHPLQVHVSWSVRGPQAALQLPDVCQNPGGGWQTQHEWVQLPSPRRTRKKTQKTHKHHCLTQDNPTRYNLLFCVFKCWAMSRLGSGVCPDFFSFTLTILQYFLTLLCFPCAFYLFIYFFTLTLFSWLLIDWWVCF